MESNHPSIEKAIKYIEENLNEAIDLTEIAKVASYSQFHFSRIFKQATGENINNMIKRLRLAQSTRELMYQKSSITEVGLNIGYETPSSFNKVFKQAFNMSPSEYKKKTEENLKNYLKELQTKPEIIYIEKEIHMHFDRSLGEYNDAAINAWGKLIKKNELDKNSIDFSNKRYFGLCYDNPKITEYEKMRYEACISMNTNESNSLNSKQVKVIPKGKYAVLKFIGDYYDLYDVWFQFYGWIYNKKLQLDNFPPIEEYLDSPIDVLNRKVVNYTTNLMLKLDN